MSVDYGLITDSTTVVVTGGAQSDNSVHFRNIRIALESQFNTAAGQAGITTKIFENIDYDTGELAKNTVGSEWVRGTLLPGETVTETLGQNGRDLHTGIFQIDYYCATGIGGFNEKLDTLANNIRKG